MTKHRPRLNEEEYKLIQEFRGIQRNAESVDLNHKDVKQGWLKTKTASLFFKNPSFKEPDFDPDKINWEEVVKNANLPNISPPEQTDVSMTGQFDRLVITDTHIGMNPNPNDGYSLYGGKWDEEELEERVDIVLHTVLSRRKSNILIIDELGDLMDGWDGKTVRRQHDLPQNMTNQTAFDVALRFKINLVGNLAQVYDKVHVNNICEDNHSGAFGYVVNSAFKIAIESMTENVKVMNYRKFMNHYRIGKNVFIISHGKDSENLKFGFTPHIKDNQIQKITDYIDEHFLYQPDVRIEFSKGDSHQLLFDHSSSDKFDYFNYMAFSPSSSWVQANYKKGKSGFTFFNYRDTNDYNIHHEFFKWKK